MFGKKRFVIYFSRNKFLVAKVVGKKIKNSKEYNWDNTTLDLSLAKAAKEFKIKTLRILLSKEVSYVLRLNVPSNLSGQEERNYIAKKASETIPENLTDLDWDYREVRFGDAKSEKEKSVIVFAPVKGLFKLLSDSANKLNINVEAVEAEAISAVRNASPIIGLAIKEDLGGKDADVLNISPLDLVKEEVKGEDTSDDSLLIEEAKKLKEDEEEKEIKPDEEKAIQLLKVTKDANLFSTILIIVVILTIIAGGGYLVYRFNIISSMIRQDDSNESETIEMVTPSAGPTPIPTLAPEGIDLSSYSLQIQNGSGTAGEADLVLETLAAEGFEDIQTSNADSFDYQETVVRLGSDVLDQVYDIVDRALNSDYKLVKEENTDDSFDIVIIVGKRV